MARVDTLPHFLTDVADAIRTKAGTSELIQASTFDTAISNIPSGGGNLQEKSVTVTESGETVINPDEGYDGMSKVTVDFQPTYITLDHISTPNNSYLATDIVATNNIEVEMKFSASNVSNKPLFGTSAGPNYYHVTLYSRAYYWGLNNGEGSGGSISADLSTYHTIIFNNSDSKVIVDGTEIGNCTGTTSTSSLELFRRRAAASGSQYYYLVGHVKYVIIRNKSTNTVLKNLIPKIRLSDGIIGLYDTVSNTFYTSSGTANFGTNI